MIDIDNIDPPERRPSVINFLLDLRSGISSILPPFL
jgi:hypothetical protein